jgi:hypothetical protein
MKAMVVVFAPADAKDLLPWPNGMTQHQAEANGSAPPPDKSDAPGPTDSMPPFWTWFIQNPRPVKRV